MNFHIRMFCRTNVQVYCLVFACLCLTHAGVFAAGPYCDAIVFGDQQSEQQHAMKMTGNVSIQTVATEIGSVQEKYAVRQCAGREAAITVSCALPEVANAAPTFAVLEVEEIHNRQWQTFGYSVLVNEKEVYFRTYEEMAGGPNHYFVRIDRSLITDPKLVAITFRNRGEAAFRVSRLWLYADFFGLAEQEHTFQPMEVLCPGPFGKLPSWTDFRLGYFGAPTAISYAYEKQYGQYLDRGLALIAEKGVPAQLNLTAFFCGSPEGPDGKGGFFSDPKYCSTHYMRGKLYPDYPNPWSNAPGSPSLVEPTINQYLNHTREDNCRYVQRQRSFQKAKGLATPPLSLCSDVGPAYATDGDFSEFARQAAKQDGVRLDPEHFTPEGRLWLFRSVARYFAGIAKAYRAGVGRDSVLVDRGTVSLPTDQLSENLYNHPWWGYPYPVGDPRWFNWQTGMARGMWSSGEMGPEIRASYDYAICQGKLTKVNQYASGKKVDFYRIWLVNEYELGFRFSALFGSTEDMPAILSELDGIGKTPTLPAVHHERKLLEVFIGATNSVGLKEHVIATENLAIQSANNTANGLTPVNPKLPGSITYKLLADEQSDGPATLFLDMVGMTGTVDVAAGSSPDQLIPAGKLVGGQFKDVGYGWHPLTWGGPVAQLTLPRSPDGKLPGYVKITFTKGYLQRVRVSIPWDRITGHPTDAAVPAPYDEKMLKVNDDYWCWVSQHSQESVWTRKESRILRLWVQQRRLTEMMLDQYRQLGGQDSVLTDAQALYQQGLYGSGYRRMIGEISQLLPARYAVRGHGCLGRYPVQVQMPNDDAVVLITLKKCSPEMLVFETDAEQSNPCTVKIGNLVKGKEYWLERIGDREYRLVQGAKKIPGATAVQVADGTATLDLSVGPETLKFPRKITGICVGRDNGKVHLWSDDAQMFGGVYEYHFKVATDAVLKRREEHSDAWTKNISGGGDFCTAELNEKNEITMLESVYGTETGVIKSYEGPGFAPGARAGVITLENGHRYELLWGGRYKTRMDTALLQADAPRAYNLDMLASGLRPGQRVEMTYTPSPTPERPARILTLKQPNTVVFEDLFDGGENAWQAKTVETANLRYYWFATIKGPALTTKTAEPGYLVYKITNQTPFGDTGVHVYGRNIIDPRCFMDFFTSPDGKTWSKRGRIQAGEQLSEKFMMVDVTEEAKGRTEFFLKIQLNGTAGWCNVHRVYVRTSKP